MLDAFAVIIADEFLDLALVVLALVQGDADRAIGGDHRLAEQAGRLALDVEILLLFEAEDLAVEGRPGAHLAAAHVVRQMVEQVEADVVLGFRFRRAGHLIPIVVDAAVGAMAIDEVQQRTADAFQRRNAVERLAGGGGLGAARDRRVIGSLGVLHPECHRARRRAVRRAEIGGVAAVFAVDQQVDAALLVTGDGARLVRRGGDEAQRLELLGQRIRIGRGEFAEFEAVEPHRVDVDMVVGLGGIGHQSGLPRWYHPLPNPATLPNWCQLIRMRHGRPMPSLVARAIVGFGRFYSVPAVGDVQPGQRFDRADL